MNPNKKFSNSVKAEQSAEEEYIRLETLIKDFSDHSSSQVKNYASKREEEETRTRTKKRIWKQSFFFIHKRLSG